MKPSTSRWDGLILAQMVTLLLLCLSYARIAGDTQSAAFMDVVLDALFEGPIWGTSVGYDLAWFAAAVLLLHVLYAVVCWMLGRLSAVAWPSARLSIRKHVLLWFALVTVGLLAHNASSFPPSSLGEPYADAMGVRIFGVAVGQAIWLAVLAAAAVTFVTAFRQWWRRGPRAATRKYAIVGLAGVAGLALSANAFRGTQTPAHPEIPNVILIGLDSLRPDLVEEKYSPHVTPNLSAFLEDSTRFSNAITPLARTFPSMCSLFTGRSPHHSGAVMNLLPRDLIDDSESLPRVLARAGYHTAYATDEVRFANIDSSFGFSQTITPPIGAAEFLIEKLADTPLNNLVANTRLGGWLFPHVHANRGVSLTYDPDTYVERVDRELDARQPLFLVVHLTLGHWPYTWAGAPAKVTDDTARWQPYYLESARRVDEQLGDVLEVLKRKRLLENAIVMVYSDHGESFESWDQSLVRENDPLVESLDLKPRWGHGTSVVDVHQYEIILGMRRYGAAWPPQREINVPVSFEDVAPTVLDLLKIPNTARFDGKSLAPLLAGTEGAARSFDGRIRFTETEFEMPAGFVTQGGKVSPSQALDVVKGYRVDRHTGRVLLRQSVLRQLLQSRQYAAIGERHLVAAVPNHDGPGFEYVGLDLDGGPIRQLADAPSAEEPELRALWAALHVEFADVLRDGPQSVAGAAVADPERKVTRDVTK